MKHLRFARTALILLLPLAMVSAGCDDNPNEPTEDPPTFSFALTTAQEVPPLADATEAAASGNVTIRLNITRDSSNAITAATVDFQATLSGFPAGSVITAAHIHEAPTGQSAGVAINTGLTSGEVTLTNGAGSFTKNGITPPSLAVVQRILDNPSGFYFNVHSQRNPSGVVRGQLVRTD
jgi:hypothetical protein